MSNRILIVVSKYPQISETYIKNEIDELWESHDVEILALNPGNYPYRTRRPHLILTKDNGQNIMQYLRDFAPSVIHGHYFNNAQITYQLARELKVPFTLRNHSFDVLGLPLEQLRDSSNIVNQDECLGILTFPFTRGLLERAGVQSRKIIECNPVINYKRFFDTTPNGKEVMNIGAAIPKKNMEDYIALSRILPDRTFNLYALGYMVSSLVEANEKIGGRVNFIAPIDPEDMLAQYKRHEWLVYTASHKFNTVGWPLAVAEAQAAGVGVCMQNIRPDVRDYVGDAGFVFDTAAEVAEIIRKPFPDDMRRRGFEWAKRCDVADHIRLLTNLWENKT